MVEIIPQDFKGNKGNDWCPKDGERYEENGRRNEYDNYKDREDDSDG